MSQHVWEGKETKYFYDLSPEAILEAFETSTGLRATGRSFIFNSMENRVYELEIESEIENQTDPRRFRIVKFYRPGRWTEAQILEEHEFLLQLVENEIPVVAPMPYLDGRTLHCDPKTGLYYAVFPKIQGRAPQELAREDLEILGRLLARMHNVGATRSFAHRLTLSPDTYGVQCLEYLLVNNQIPLTIKDAYRDVVLRICDYVRPWFEQTETRRIHGDCHLGNIVQGRTGFSWIDFDDAVNGPYAQDLWLMIPGRDEEATEQLDILLNAYEMMRPFDRKTLRLIEPLRALRYNLFSFWIASRWEDPAFKRAFPHFGTDKYWYDQLRDLQEQWQLISQTH
jgi:Ser/Thr protein kinase RdoA (MazF antagonist)